MRAHEQCCASEVKETMYFEHYPHRGLDWYERHFKAEPVHRAVAEVSNTYIFSPEAAERIRDYNPEAKIIVTVRNPIDRALSHYLFLIRGGMKLPGFEDALREQEHLIWRGKYFSHIQNWLQYFPEEQVKVLVYEDLRADAVAYGASLLRFLGVDESVPDFDEDRFRLPASKPRSKVLARALKNGAVAARDVGLERLVQTVKDSAIQRVAYRPMATNEKPDIDPATREWLKDYFREDTDALSDWLGRDLTREWFGIERR